MSGIDTEWCENENAIEWQDLDINATVTLHSGKLKNRVLKLAEEYPDEVTIKAHPDGNHGFLVAHLPKKWIKISPPQKQEWSEERRQAKREWMAALRQKQLNATDSKNAPNLHGNAEEDNLYH